MLRPTALEAAMHKLVGSIGLCVMSFIHELLLKVLSLFLTSLLPVSSLEGLKLRLHWEAHQDYHQMARASSSVNFPVKFVE